MRLEQIMRGMAEYFADEAKERPRRTISSQTARGIARVRQCWRKLGSLHDSKPVASENGII